MIRVIGNRSRIGRVRRGPRRLKSLAFVPTLFTLGNLVCGFAAIHFALRAMFDLGAGVDASLSLTLRSVQLERILPSFLSAGAGLILLGMLLDAFDGVVARVTRSTTDFGGQLDSLADIVTMGVAPAVLMVAFMTKELAGESILPSPISPYFWGRFTWVSAAVYVAFAAIRLARYNVEHARADFDHRMFRGLPSPGAAITLATLVIVQEQAEPGLRYAIMCAMPFVALATASLMVSRMPYKRFYRAYLVGRKPFGQFVALVLLLAVFASHPALTLLVVVFWYVLSGPVESLIRYLRQRAAPGLRDSSPGEAQPRRKLA